MYCLYLDQDQDDDVINFNIFNMSVNVASYQEV